MLDNFNFVPQGWECPKCGRVYAPTQMMCIACPQQSGITFTTTGTTLNITSCDFIPDETTGNNCLICGRPKSDHVKLTNL